MISDPELKKQNKNMQQPAQDHSEIWKEFSTPSDPDGHHLNHLINQFTNHELESSIVHPLTDRPLLHEACARGKLSLVRYLIEKRHLNVNAIDTCGHRVTPLHMACREGQESIVRYLLSLRCTEREGHHGEKKKKTNERTILVDVNAQDRDGYTALHYASINGHLSIVHCLLEADPTYINVNLTDNQNRTALHRAIEHNRSTVAHDLIMKAPSIDINIQNNHGWTPLHYASYQENRGLCTMLLNHGADTSLRDRDGKQPLYWGYGTWHDEEGGCTCPKPHR